MQSNISIWWRRLASLVGAGYCTLMCWFSYLAIFYDVTISHKVAFCVVFTGISLLSVAAMLFSRFQILTRLVGIVLLPAIFPLIMLCFGEWEMIIPAAAAALLIFFLSGAGETTKTVFGVIYILLYILGSLAFFMVVSFFTPTTESVILESSASPSGIYRCEVIQTDDSSGGNVTVHVEPNDRDIFLPLITFGARGYDRTVYLERPVQDTEHHAEWSTASRSEITKQLLTVSENIQLELNEVQLTKLGLPSDTETVYLRDLSDAQLEVLGVPAENDVLTFDGEVCFRTYIAVLEEYFSKENRVLDLF